MSNLKAIGQWLAIIAALYFITTQAAFRFRHPWATETEALIHVWDALTWQKVDYDELRPRD